ncbi:MAG: hypothetical protein U9P14_09645 [Gemmatimonadota bacterium]|nr:hypothetical protein [Gemmatimonadota bacterium]
MKSLKLLLVILCLLLIVLFPQSAKRISLRSPSTLISGTITTDNGYNNSNETPFIQVDTVALSRGELLFERHCNRCHSGSFVFKSGIYSVCADSLVTEMLGKASLEIDQSQHSWIVEYLCYRLPRQ